MSELTGGLVEFQFNAATNLLTFNLNLGPSFQKDFALGFNKALNLGPLGELSLTGAANATVDAGAGLNFTLGIDLSPIGGNFELTNDTTLTSLNAGKGIGLTSDGAADLKVTAHRRASSSR